MMQSAIKFFLGANAPQGFVSRFDQIDNNDKNWHTFIIKGGPGCGKSTFMRCMAEKFAKNSPKMELIACSSDKDSLDAVIFPEFKASIVDGTAPHILEATCPGVGQSIVSLGDFLDPILLKKHREEIRSISKLTTENYKQASDFLSAARAFMEDSNKIILSCTNISKIADCANHLSKKLMPPLNKKPCEKVRFLSSISGDGLTVLGETVPLICKQIIFIKDDWGAIANLFMTAIRSRALELNHDVIVCPCSMAPQSKIDHILLPDIGVAFLSENVFHDFSNLTPARRIHARRFLDVKEAAKFKKRLSYNYKTEVKLLEKAVSILNDNRILHDKTEIYYRQAMNFKPIDNIISNVVQDILRFKNT